MINIIRSNHSDSLCAAIASICLDRQNQKEIGGQFYSCENHKWYLAYEKDVLIGFCAAVEKGKYVSFNHDFIIKNKRNNGFYNLLFKERLSDFNNREIRAVCTSDSIGTFIRNNFKIYKQTKNFKFVNYGKVI